MKVTVTFVPKEEKTKTRMERMLLELDLSMPASKVHKVSLFRGVCYPEIDCQLLIVQVALLLSRSLGVAVDAIQLFKCHSARCSVYDICKRVAMETKQI